MRGRGPKLTGGASERERERENKQQQQHQQPPSLSAMNPNIRSDVGPQTKTLGLTASGQRSSIMSGDSGGRADRHRKPLCMRGYTATTLSLSPSLIKNPQRIRRRQEGLVVVLCFIRCAELSARQRPMLRISTLQIQRRLQCSAIHINRAIHFQGWRTKRNGI